MYSEAIEHNPDDAMCWSIRANCYKRLKNIEMALQDSLKAIDLNPKVTPMVYDRIVKCYLLFGDLEKANEYMGLFQNVYPKLTAFMDDQKERVNTLTRLEKKAIDCYKKRDYPGCVQQINEALKIGEECQLFKDLKEGCLKNLKKLDALGGRENLFGPISAVAKEFDQDKEEQQSVAASGMNILPESSKQLKVETSNVASAIKVQVSSSNSSKFQKDSLFNNTANSATRLRVSATMKIVQTKKFQKVVGNVLERKPSTSKRQRPQDLKDDFEASNADGFKPKMQKF